MDHGAAHRAAGAQAIASLASRLPLARAGATATVAHISSQPTASGGHLATVLGTFAKSPGESAVFTQTFVLEKQTDSHDEHFYCRNDVFVDVDAAPLPGTQPALEGLKGASASLASHAPKQTAPQSQPQQVKPLPHTLHPPQPHHPSQTQSRAQHLTAIAPAPAIGAEEPVGRVNGSGSDAGVNLPATEPVTADASHLDAPVAADSESAHEAPSKGFAGLAEPQVVSTPSAPEGAMNGTAIAPPLPDSEPTAQPEVGSTTDVTLRQGAPREVPSPVQTHSPQSQTEVPLSTNSAIPNGSAAEDDEQQQVRTSAPAAKKTWAAIVSSQEDAAVATQSDTNRAASVSSATAANDAPSHATRQDLEAESGQPAVIEQVENIPPAGEGDTSKGGKTSVQSGHAQRPVSHSMSNGHRPNHIGGRSGHQRTFGPSAVVQLSSLDPTLLQDPKSLSADFREEFSKYGFKLRHVEVKLQKGIAFVEYETLEGVRAAVAAWANGPRKEGAFAGIPLNVSEKRPYNKWRPSMRGGRGGTRGGRRNRPTSAPMS